MSILGFITSKSKVRTFPAREVRITWVVEQDRLSRTLQATANELGLTRERVRQIFTKKTGRGWGEDRIAENKTIRGARRLEEVAKVRGAWKMCRAPLSRASTGSSHKYCSKKCRKEWEYLDREVTLRCDNCKEKFNPYRNHKAPSVRSKKHFCSRACYIEYRKNHRKWLDRGTT